MTPPSNVRSASRNNIDLHNFPVHSRFAIPDDLVSRPTLYIAALPCVCRSGPMHEGRPVVSVSEVGTRLGLQKGIGRGD